MIEEFKRLEQELKAQLCESISEWVKSSIANEGDYSNTISHKEKKLKTLQDKIKQLEESKSPEEWNVMIFVFTNFRSVIEKTITKKLFRKLPEIRNSNDALEKWVPYLDNEKTISDLLEEFKVRDGFNFNVVYFNGQQDFEKMSIEIDNAIAEGSAVAIIDLLSVNDENEMIVRRFDTQRMKSTILPVCLQLDDGIRKYMEGIRKKIFTVSNSMLRNERCCYFVKPHEEDFFIQELRKIYPAKGKTKNTIIDCNTTNSTDIRTLNLKLG